jgi:APA family basic amino acid/polyamine antiporter
VLLAVAGCFLAAPPGGAAAAPAAPGPLAFFTAVPLVIFAYDNYYAPAYFGEEFEDPRRAVPRALFIGVGCIASLYLLLAYAFAHALPHEVLTGSELPGADLAVRLLGEGGRGLLQLLMLVSLLSCMNATTLLGSRILLALGRDGGLAGRVNEGGTPAPALAFTLALAFVFLLGRGFETAIALMAPFILLNYALCFGALLRLRRRPGEGHFQAWAWTPWAALAVALALLGGSLAAEPRLAAGLAGGLALAWPLYRLSRLRPS